MIKSITKAQSYLLKGEVPSKRILDDLAREVCTITSIFDINIVEMSLLGMLIHLDHSAPTNAINEHLILLMK